MEGLRREPEAWRPARARRKDPAQARVHRIPSGAEAPEQDCPQVASAAGGAGLGA